MEITKHMHTGAIIPIDELTAMAMNINQIVEMYADNPAVLVEHGSNARKLFDTGGFSKSSVAKVFLELLGENRSS